MLIFQALVWKKKFEFSSGSCARRWVCYEEVIPCNQRYSNASLARILILLNKEVVTELIYKVYLLSVS